MKKQPYNTRLPKSSIAELKPSNLNDTTQTQKTLDKAKKELAKQNNVLVKIPPTNKHSGYTVILDADEAKRKYPDLQHFPIVS